MPPTGETLKKQYNRLTVRNIRNETQYALIVDAKDAKAKSFYEYFGFIVFTDVPFCLYLTIL